MPFELNIYLAFILLPVGILMLVKGADVLVDGAVAISDRLGISPLIVGLTVVAMGTSAPEVAASVAASLEGDSNLAIGNVFGSNIANLALVAGVSAIIRPVVVNLTILKREFPALLITSFVLLVLMFNLEIGRLESVVLLCLFAAIIYLSVRLGFRDAKERPKELEKLKEEVLEKEARIPKSLFKASLFIVIGLVALAVGAKVTLESAKFIGSAVGMSNAVIGLTIVAIGTSLPELITCVVAAVKGHDEISIGNIVGSNVFNTLLVIGAAGAVSPLTGIEPIMLKLHFWIMIGISIVFFVTGWKFKKISRPAGIILAIFYIAYLVICYIFQETPQVQV